MDSQTEQKNNLLVIALAVFVAGGFLGWQLAIGPLLKQKQNLDRQKGDNLKKQALIKNLADLDKESGQYSSRLAESKGLALLADELGKMAAKAGLVLISATPLDSQNMEDYTKQTLQIEARGGFHELGQFVSLVENSSLFIKVSNLHVQQPQSLVDIGPGLRITLSLSVFSKLHEVVTK